MRDESDSDTVQRWVDAQWTATLKASCFLSYAERHTIWECSGRIAEWRPRIRRIQDSVNTRGCAQLRWHKIREPFVWPTEPWAVTHPEGDSLSDAYRRVVSRYRLALLGDHGLGAVANAPRSARCVCRDPNGPGWMSVDNVNYAGIRGTDDSLWFRRTCCYEAPGSLTPWERVSFAMDYVGGPGECWVIVPHRWDSIPQNALVQEFPMMGLGAETQGWILGEGCFDIKNMQSTTIRAGVAGSRLGVLDVYFACLVIPTRVVRLRARTKFEKLLGG
jgi:hypothetical protein